MANIALDQETNSHASLKELTVRLRSKNFMNTEWLKELWLYRELIYFFVWRDLKVRYKQTILGVAWAVIQPLFTMLVFFVFFGKMAKIPSDDIPYPVFSYTALVAWAYFSGSVMYAANSLISNANLLTKVYFPRATLPCAAVISGIPDFAIASVVLVGIIVYFHIPLSLGLLFWPIASIPLVFLALGISMLLSALNVKFRDVKYAVPFVFQLWLFVTPIVYPSSIVPERFRLFFFLNPLAGIIEAFRASAIPFRSVDWDMLGISFSVSLFILLVGFMYFHKVERTFADVI